MTLTIQHEAALEEACLLAQIGVGDSHAFRRLYDRYSTPLFSLGLRMLKNPSEAEEALQDTFVKIWKNAAYYDARKSRPFTWAVTIMRRTCIDRIRKLNREPEVTTFEPEQDQEWATAETVRESVALNETRNQVEEALKNVPAKQKKALELALFSGMTHSEIANSLEQPLGTVKSWLKRGLFQLRNSLTETVL
ncbi:MAG: sigma-70 family RNA polymerase sigma factor [Verrucomicrobia bacterium]|nr:sigma-70 family RNA polymerase sigma factor [Verrucomicrobiota bacterium]MDA1068541.1 sigma-70 family RNA polymerase sigma factor [Verrucomicrobiota bacterium]